VGSIGISDSERAFLGQIFADAAGSAGSDCVLTLYNKYTDGDLQGQYSEPVTYSTSVIFDEYPSVKTLRSLNWYSEDEEILPCIIHIPSFIDNKEISIRKGSRIDLKFGNYTKNYTIAEVKAPYMNIVWYTCKLVPYFDKQATNIEDPSYDSAVMDKKYTYFDVDK
jgi:hypothetical protein